MTADLLRRAAARAHELADGATPGPWRATSAYDVGDLDQIASPADPGEHGGDVVYVQTYEGGGIQRSSDAALIAACDPPFLRAVGEWLRLIAADIETGFTFDDHLAAALAVARALLGEDEA